MESRVAPADCIFAITAIRRLHLMKCGDAVTRFELGNPLTHRVYDTCNVIALIEGRRRWVLLEKVVGTFPVLGVAARDNDFGYHLVRTRRWHGRVDNLDLGARMDKCFFHGE